MKVKRKILILDNDTHTINPISQLLTILNFEPVVLHNWSNKMKAVALADMAAIFVNIELPTVKTEALVKEVENLTKGQIVLFFLYARTFAPAVRKCLQLSHAGSIKKPVEMEELYYLLEQNLRFPEISKKNTELQKRLSGYEQRFNALSRWFTNFENMISTE